MWGYKPYVPVGDRRRKAAQAMEKRRKAGHPVAGIHIEGRTIAHTFWGKSWCENLERYSDYENRLPRGRTYVRNGSVVDLQIKRGEIVASVSGSSLYTVKLTIAPVPKAHWESICKDCAGGIDSLVELLQGRFSKGVMERMCLPKTGLFPSPREIKLACSCPDWADMCKHVAAVLYGVGARLDSKPELLFLLRGVDATDLIAAAGKASPAAKAKSGGAKVLEADDLADICGHDMAGPDEPPAPVKKKTAAKKKAPAKKKAAVKKATKKKR